MSELESLNKLAPVLGCGDWKQVTVSRRRDAEESRPVKCTNILDVILYHTVVALKVNYSVFICVSCQLVMPRALFAFPFE
jgi:hypothetical protein